MNAVRLVASLLSLMLSSTQAATPGSRSELLQSVEQLRIDESSRCYSHMMSGSELRPLVGKVQLPMMRIPPDQLANLAKPTAFELSAVQRWQAMLSECFAAGLRGVEAAGLSELFGPVYSQASKEKTALLSLFAGGEMSYAEFNRRISELNVDNLNRLAAAREAFRRDLYHVEDGAAGYPLWEASDIVPRSREQLLLSRREEEAIAAYRRSASYVSAHLFLANIAALNSNVISVNIGGKTYRIVGSRLGSMENGNWLWTEGGRPLSEGPATVVSWTQSAKSSSDFSLSGQVVAEGKVYEIATLGRFQVLLLRH
jgi:hypothetical protein